MLVLDFDKAEDLETFYASVSNICIIFAPPRTGKTSFMAALANATTFHRPFLKEQHRDIQELNNGGFSIPMTDTVVVANYHMGFRKFGYSVRNPYFINAFRLGYSNSEREMSFILPHSKIFLTEGQKYLDSHISLAFRAYQSRAYEQCGHIDLNIFIDVQRPTLINANVRDIACFLEVERLEKKYKKGELVCCTWCLRFIRNSKSLERYLTSGDTSQTVEFKVKYNHDVFKLYNSQVYRPKWFDGHYKNEGLLRKTIDYENSVRGFKEYNRQLDDEVPEKKDGDLL